MALTYPERYGLAQAPLFLRRIEIAAVKYAVYLHNSSATGQRGQWAQNMIDSSSLRADAVQWLRWYIVENVAAALALDANGADSLATDGAIQAEVDVQVGLRYPTE